MEEELQELRVLEDQPTVSVNEMAINAQTLLEAVLNNSHEEINNLIEESTVEILKHKYPTYGYKNIIIIACIDEKVSANTLDTLCASLRSRHGYDMDCLCFDEDWFKWDPIHYVVRSADPEKLLVLLNNSFNVNSLTTFSENALHVLLEYQQCTKVYNTFFCKGDLKSIECVIINKENENIFYCAEILIEAGIDVNHSNLWNEVPICIAIRYEVLQTYLQIAKLLLSMPAIDIDNFKEGDVTIRDYLKENCYLCTYSNGVVQSNALFEDPVKMLFNYLKLGNEEAFIEFNNGNIRECVNKPDGDDFNSSGNMLHLCFKKGYLAYLQHELYREEMVKSDITDNLMLKVFLSKGFGRCIDHLLKNGADPNLTFRKFPYTLLEAAATVGYYPLVALILHQNNHKTTPDEIFKILPKLYEKNHDLTNHTYYRKFVLSLLLNKLIKLNSRSILKTEELDILNDILKRLISVFDNEEDSENIRQLLRIGASLTRRDENNTMIIQHIPADILKLHFDDCIEDDSLFYNTIIEDDPRHGYSETRALEFLANSDEKNELLTHPLLIHFIYNKWSRHYYFLCADLVLYLLFLLSIYAYMIFSHKIPTCKVINPTFYTLLVIHLLKEAIQLIFLYRLKYFLDTSNYLELIVIICSFINIFNYNEYCAVIAILFSTVIFVTLLAQMPMCAKFTIIFSSTKYFFQYAGFYFIQFVSFALVFYIIFPFQKNTENISEINAANKTTPSEDTSSNSIDIVGDLFKSLFYTLVFFTGEFGDRVLEPEGFPVFGRVVMTAFIFCMTIILNNLLVGLMVVDMDEMQRAGKVYKQIKIANFISRMNSVVKRLDRFKKNYWFIGYIINVIHIFQKGSNKKLLVSQQNNIFDSENLKYLKSITNRRKTDFHNDILKKVCYLIQKGRLDGGRKYKEQHH